MTDLVGLLVPLGGMAMVFGVFWLITNYLARRADLAGGHHEGFTKLAQDALAGQERLAKENAEIAERLERIEKMLDSV